MPLLFLVGGPAGRLMHVAVPQCHHSLSQVGPQAATWLYRDATPLSRRWARWPPRAPDCTTIPALLLVRGPAGRLHHMAVLIARHASHSEPDSRARARLPLLRLCLSANTICPRAAHRASLLTARALCRRGSPQEDPELVFPLAVSRANAACSLRRPAGDCISLLPRPSDLPSRDGLAAIGVQCFAFSACPPARLWSQLLDTFAAPCP